MNSLLMMALVLVGAWIVVVLVFKMVGLLVNVLLLIGALLLVAWAWQKIRGPSREPPTAP